MARANNVPLVLLTAFALLLAGCAGGDDPAPPGNGETPTGPGPTPPNGGGAAPPPGPGEEREPAVFEGEGTVLASTIIGGFGAPALEDIRVDANATILFAEIEWADPVQDIDLALASPSAGQTGTAQNYDHMASGGGPGMPNSPHSLTVQSPEAGTWLASAFASAVAAQVDYRVVVTVFYAEGEVPDGYSAL